MLMGRNVTGEDVAATVLLEIVDGVSSERDSNRHTYATCN